MDRKESSMFALCRRLGARMRELGRVNLTGLEELFGQWIDLAPNMDEGARKRLFFPLADVLALSVSGVRCGLVV